MRDTLRLGTGEVDVIGSKGSENEEFFPCAGYRHVEPPCTAGLIERTEIHRDLSRRVRSISERQDDNVSLLTLNILEVFTSTGSRH